MKSATLLLAIGAAVVLSFSCNKNDNEAPKPSPTSTKPSITVDSLAGIYIGQHQTHKIDYAYGMGQTFLRDTTYTAIDTLYVKRISVDSFEIDGNDWEVYGKSLHFAYSSSNTYNLSRDYPPTEDDTISIRIDPATDSLVIYKFFGTRGTSAYTRQTHTFSGKLQ